MVLTSIGKIAEELRTPIHRVRYAMTKCGIRPACRVGNAHGYDRGVIEVLRRELAGRPLRKAG